MLRGNRVVFRGVLGGLLALTGAPYLGRGLIQAVERQLIYHPFKDGAFPNPTTPLAPEDVYVTAGDGVVTHGWYIPNPRGLGNGKVLVYFHGNAGSIAHRWAWGVQLTQAGVDVLMMDYRGYGRSEGDPSEDGMRADAHAVWKHLVDDRGIAPENIILYGKSLGGFAASTLASEHAGAGGLVLQSTFTCIPDMAAVVLPIVPRSWIFTQLDIEAMLPKVAAPTLVIHSTGDRLVPFAHSERNARAAGHLHRHLVYHGYDHNDLVMGKGDEIVRAIAGMIGTA